MKPAGALSPQTVEELRGRRVLALGTDSVIAAGLRAQDIETRCEPDLERLDLPPDAFDVAVLIDGLERTPWDRWVLQQAHRAVVDGGWLLLIVSNFHALASWADLAFLAGRATRELAARARRALGRPPARGRFRGRRYRHAQVERMLESLGWIVRESSAGGRGGQARFAGARRDPGALSFRCERGPSRYGSDPRRPWPDPEAHRRRFERTHGAFVADRARWLERHPRFRPEAVEPFALDAYRGARVLVLAPHPDDELIGCGGTLARLIANGARVTVVHATDGSEAASLWHAPPEIRHTVRLTEAAEVGRVMGFDSLVFWREDNARFRVTEERVRDLARLLESERPALVFTPFVTDVHPDHRVLCRMLARALRDVRPPLANTRVLSYQVWSLLPPNRHCEIGAVVDRVEDALLRYVTAMKVDDYVHFCEDRNYYDSVTLTGRPGLVEAFFEIPAAEYPDLVATIEEPHA